MIKVKSVNNLKLKPASDVVSMLMVGISFSAKQKGCLKKMPNIWKLSNGMRRSKFET